MAAVWWTHLVLLTRALAVLGQSLQRLRDQVHVGLVDVEAEQAQTPRGASTHDVQKLQRLTHQVVVGLVVLAAQEVLRAEEKKLHISSSGLENCNLTEQK